MPASVLGPTLAATLSTDRLDACIAAWCGSLQQRVHSEYRLDSDQANLWSAPALEGARVVWLQNQLREPWLQLIETEHAALLEPFQRSGWLALEICVANVDALHLELAKSPFRIIGEPADLDVSPNIRAMQVLGPAGEVLYLTEIKAAVPGFELPSARCAVDKLFIPVLLAADRDAALDTYEQFPGPRGIKFETKITVLNRARGYPVAQRHPVATRQLRGNSLIEIDQLAGLQPPTRDTHALPPGISLLSFALTDMAALPADSSIYTIAAGPFAGRRAALLRGNGGELLQLIETD